MGCQGKQGSSVHGQNVYKCAHCGSVGCESSTCTNRNFYGGKCLKCGKASSGKIKVG